MIEIKPVNVEYNFFHMSKKKSSQKEQTYNTEIIGGRFVAIKVGKLNLI